MENVAHPIDSDAHEMVLLLTGYLSYRALLGRRDELRVALRPDEAARLVELERVFTARATEEAIYLSRLHERHPIRLPVSFHDDEGEVHDGQLRNLSTRGFFVETAHIRLPGERATFRFVDERAAREWHFAGEVAHVRGGPGGGMGLRFVGIPVELRLGRVGRPILTDVAA